MLQVHTHRQPSFPAQPYWPEPAPQLVPSIQEPPPQQEQTSSLKWIPSPYSWQNLISSHHDLLNLSTPQHAPSRPNLSSLPTAISKPTRHPNTERSKAIIAPSNRPASVPTPSYVAPQSTSQRPSQPPPQPAQIPEPRPSSIPTISPIQQPPRPHTRAPSSSGMKSISTYFTPSPKTLPTVPRPVQLPTFNLLQQIISSEPVNTSVIPPPKRPMLSSSTESQPPQKRQRVENLLGGLHLANISARAYIEANTAPVTKLTGTSGGKVGSTRTAKRSKLQNYVSKTPVLVGNVNVASPKASERNVPVSKEPTSGEKAIIDQVLLDNLLHESPRASSSKPSEIATPVTKRLTSATSAVKVIIDQVLVDNVRNQAPHTDLPKTPTKPPVTEIPAPIVEPESSIPQTTVAQLSPPMASLPSEPSFAEKSPQPTGPKRTLWAGGRPPKMFPLTVRVGSPPKPSSLETSPSCQHASTPPKTSPPDTSPSFQDTFPPSEPSSPEESPKRTPSRMSGWAMGVKRKLDDRMRTSFSSLPAQEEPVTPKRDSVGKSSQPKMIIDLTPEKDSSGPSSQSKPVIIDLTLSDDEEDEQVSSGSESMDDYDPYFDTLDVQTPQVLS